MAKQLLIITGTPGTGKSTMAKFLGEKLGLFRIDLHELIEKDSALSSDFNKEKDCYDLDMGIVEERVRELLVLNKDKVVVLDSHVAHLLSAEMMLGVIVMQCSDLKILEKRLVARKYSEQKVKENLDSEIFEVCLDEAKELEIPLLQFDSSLGLDESLVLKEVQELIKAR